MTSKKILNALEKVFVCEIENKLPFQSRAKIYQGLASEGLLSPMTINIGSGWSAAIVTGFQLTHLGRLVYCSSCDGQDDDGTGDGVKEGGK